MKEKKAGEILHRYLEKTYSSIGKKYSEMFRSWENIAGKDLKDHTRIREFIKGTVIIEADHPAYMQLLQLRTAKILGKLKKYYKELNIKNLRIIVSSRNTGQAESPEISKEEKLGKAEFNELMNKLKNAINSNSEKN